MLCDDGYLTQNLRARNDVKLLKQVLDVYFHLNKPEKFKTKKEFIENLVKKYYNGNLIDEPKVLSIQRIQVQQSIVCKNICLSLLEKFEAVERYESRKNAYSKGKLYEKLLNEEECILGMFHQAYKDIIHDAFLIKYIHLQTLRKIILNLALLFKTKISKHLKTIHSCPVMMTRVLNLFFILFGICKNEVADEWMNFLTILNDTKTIEIVENFKFENGLNKNHEERVSSFLNETDLNFLHLIINNARRLKIKQFFFPFVNLNLVFRR